MSNKNKILVVGVGNTLRGDDGIGASVCNAIEKSALLGVTTITTQQLHIEQAEEFAAFDILIIVDAALSGEAVAFGPITETHSESNPASHRINAATLLALIKQLYKKDTQLLLCAVRGENFDMGEQLSPSAKKNAGIAAGTILNWLAKI